jgi:uncharacterized protein YraI/protocatechuate 3,4-dioxygenase beta subunit
MIEQTSQTQRHRMTNRAVHCRPQVIFHLIVFLISALMIVACSSTPSIPSEVTVQAALPTPTPEPTFTPSPPPSDTPIATPTATPTPEPTPTPLPQASLSGRILDQEANQPIVDAQVSVDDQTTTTDDKGRYILTDLPPGQYILSVTHPDYDPGLSSIFTLAAGQEQSLDLALYAPNASPYPKDPMLTNPLDPNGAPTAEDAEQLARLQGLTGEVVNVRETKLSGEYLVNYKIGEEVRAAVAELSHEVWELTDDAGRVWWIINVCGNLASPLSAEVAVATPQPRALPPMAEVVVDGVTVQACASETCAEVGALAHGKQVEVFGCLADGSWCQVGLPGGGSGWCPGQSLRHLAVAQAVPVVMPAPTSKPETAVGNGKIAFESNSDIYVINADGSGLERLTNSQAVETGPAWSPNGQQIAFSSWTNGNDEIYVVTADGSGLARLTDSPTVDSFPAWSPSGQQIAFQSDRDGNFEIYRINANGTELTRLTDHPALDQAPAWSPDGRQIIFHSKRDGNLEIYAMNVDGSDLVRFTNHPADDVNPAWSPDGQRIIFQSNRDGNFEIYVMTIDGSDLSRLTDHPSFDLTPDWSPDGQQIVFVSGRDGHSEVYVMNVDGSDLTQLTFLVNNCCPAWSR